MNHYMLRNLMVCLFLLLAAPRTFGDYVLDFEGLGLVNGNSIPQSYGDNLLFDVSYRELDGFGNANSVSNVLGFWMSGYGDLENVVWGSDLNTSRVAEIRIDSLTANPLTLNSFDAADWDGTANDQTFRVFDGSYGLLFELTNFDVTDTTRDTVSPNVSADTMILQWDYPWAVAVDNISITAVPEPNSLALAWLCSGMYAFRRRRITV